MRFTKLKYNGFENDLIFCDEVDDKNIIRYIFKFDNDYGASIIKGGISIGGKQDLFELAILKFENDKGWLVPNLKVIKDKVVDDYVIGDLTNEKVLMYLQKIKEYRE